MYSLFFRKHSMCLWFIHKVILCFYGSVVVFSKCDTNKTVSFSMEFSVNNAWRRYEWVFILIYSVDIKFICFVNALNRFDAPCTRIFRFIQFLNRIKWQQKVKSIQYILLRLVDRNFLKKSGRAHVHLTAFLIIFSAEHSCCIHRNITQICFFKFQ